MYKRYKWDAHVVININGDQTMKDELFGQPGKNEMYELIRTRQHEKDKKAIQYWNQKYNQNKQFLDANFARQFSEATEARLWELTLSDYLRISPKINLLPSRAYGTKNKSKPDFCFIHERKTFFLEAVTINPGQNEALSIRFQDSLGTAHASPRAEFKEKICSAIKSKLDRYNSGYKNIVSKDSGFILAISSTPIGLHINPMDAFLELSCLFGLSERIYDPSTNKLYHEHEPVIYKKSNFKPLQTDYFLNETFSHLSAVIISRNLSVFYPEYKDLPSIIFLPSKEFILAHNPYALNNCPKNLFPVLKEIVRKEDCFDLAV